MELLHFDQIYRRPYLIPAIITVSSAAAILLNIYGLSLGMTNVLPHLLYIPIILAAYFYPRRGIAITLVLSILYLSSILAFSAGRTDIILAAAARVVVFLVIAAIISWLSDRMHNDASLCRRMVSIVSSSNDAIIGKTLDGIITDWNPGAEALYGYTEKEAVGKHISLIVPLERADEIPRFLNAIRNGETVHRVETTRKVKDGHRIQVSLSISPIKNPQGEIVGASTSAHDITDQTLLRDEALRAKSDWELTFDAVPDLIAIINRHHRIVRVNRPMAERLGLTPEDMVGRACYELVHHTSIPPDFCPHSALLRDGVEHTLDITEKNLGGNFTLTVSPVRNPKGEIIGSVHILHDITERKKAEIALEERERFLELLLETISSPIFYKDVNGVYLGCNTAFEHYLGLPRNQILGKTVYDISPPELARMYAARDQELFDHPGSQEYESQVKYADGSLHSVIFSKATFSDHDGKVQGLVGVILDITERTRAEEALRKMTEETNRFFTVSLDLLCIATTDGRFVRLNPEWEKTLGYPITELVGRQLLDYVHPEDIGMTTEAMSVLAHDEPVLNFTNRYRHKDGTYRWIEWRSFPYEGKLIYASARDVTDHKLEQEALQLANKKINMLSSITRHDILNQLMGLRTYLELSRDTNSRPEMLEYITKQERVAEAIGRQIEFTRFYQDIGVRAPAWFSLKHVIRLAAAGLNLEGISLQVTMAPVEIFVDPLIEKVFYNLMENSQRHGEHVTQITISTKETDEGLIIFYQDDGAGIPVEDKTRLFRKGFGKHTGLGLFLSREILAITGIAISESGEPGRGVRFEITVPRDRYRPGFDPAEPDPAAA
jgi:PAS domain S-box-containing protein